MKFSISIKDLQSALGRISNAIPQRSPITILENIKMELFGNSLSLTATDLEITTITKIDVSGIEDGSALFPGKKFIDTVRALDLGEVEISVDNSNYRINIKTENGSYKLSGLNSDEFPRQTEFVSNVNVEFPMQKLSSIIDKTTFVCSTDDFRPAMTGVLFQFKGDSICAVATDGFRLVRIIDKEVQTGSNAPDIIIPPKALNIVNKSFISDNVVIDANSTHVKFSDGITTVIARLIDETYPDYSSVIPPDGDKKLLINRDSILSTIRRVSIYSHQQTKQVRFKADSNILYIKAEDSDTGGEANESLTCDYSNELIEIGFNSQYVKDALDRVNVNNVEFTFTTPLRPALIAPTEQNGQDILMLLMPIRLNN